MTDDIKLNESAAALIVEEDMSLNLVLPRDQDSDNAPPNVALLLAFFLAHQNKELAAAIQKNYTEQILANEAKSDIILPQ